MYVCMYVCSVYISKPVRRVFLSIGAGAIELAGARAPQISDSRGTGHNRFCGAPKCLRIVPTPHTV